MLPPVCKAQYIFQFPPHFSWQRSLQLFLKPSDLPCLEMAASTLIFNSLATRATVSNLGLLWQVSKSMIVRAFILSRSANFLCVKCCRLRSDRTFHANKSRGLFTIHHLYLIVGCAIAHINNHTTHIVWVTAHNLKQRAIWIRVSK